MLGGPDRADGDPVEINLNIVIYGTPDEIARKLDALRDAGAGERSRQSLRRFAKEVMLAFFAA